MFAKVTCPYCGDKQSVPENMRGKRVNCPNCQTPYMAGQGHAGEAQAPANIATPIVGHGTPGGLAGGVPASQPLARTMLAPLEEPIRYSCPRCAKSIESPRSMAGQKLHCPHCSQRLQVPAPPAPPAPALPPLNKTILAQSDVQGIQGGGPPALPSQSDVDRRSGADDADNRRQHCLECGRSLAGRADLLTCPKCGSVFCCSACYRDHNDFAHPRKRQSREYVDSADPAPSTGMAVTGLVLGIIGFVLAFIPCYGALFGVLLGILGATFAAIGLSQASNDGAGKGMATTGLILSVLAIIWAPLWYFIIFASLAQGPHWFR